jgi:hypothetical protein
MKSRMHSAEAPFGFIAGVLVIGLGIGTGRGRLRHAGAGALRHQGP